MTHDTLVTITLFTIIASLFVNTATIRRLSKRLDLLEEQK